MSPDVSKEKKSLSQIRLTGGVGSLVCLRSCAGRTNMVDLLIKRLFGHVRVKSKDVAKNRLKLILAHDRTDISPGMIEQMKNEIIKVLSKHTEFDHDAVDFRLTRGGGEHRLVADIPLATSPRRGAG